MKIAIFSGPTLQIDDLVHGGKYSKFFRVGKSEDTLVFMEDIEIGFFPPVGEGDVYKLIGSEEELVSIGIIDGYFESTTSVWHKEILYALYNGIHVYGSASMGALRAAELSAYGMKGVGKIFQAYEAGFLEDDDEVTVVHGPKETGYIKLNEAMVDIRATLEQARAEQVISQKEFTLLIKGAKGCFYKNRNYDDIFDQCVMQGEVDPKRRDRIECWISENSVNQKKADAILMVSRMVDDISGGLSAHEANFFFEDTLIWRQSLGEV